MIMREATYTLIDGTRKTFRYDPLAPCVGCGLPVVEASMGGTVLCPWCDSGYDRQGGRINSVRPRKATQAEYEAAVEALKGEPAMTDLFPEKEPKVPPEPAEPPDEGEEQDDGDTTDEPEKQDQQTG